MAFDAIAHLQFKGGGPYGSIGKPAFHVPGPMMFEIHELQMAAHGDVAFCHYLGRYGGTGRTARKRSDGCARPSVSASRGKWLIVHEHFSAPFDMETSKAMFDLEP